MTGSEDPSVPGRGDALRARRAQLRRRTRRRRRIVVAALAGAVALLLVAPVTSGGGHQAQVAVGSNAGSAARDPNPSVRTPATRRARRSRSDGRDLAARENAAIDRLLARQPFISAGGGERREIALTFDDGPGPYTPRLLDELQRLHVPATFFEIGFMFQWFHASLSRELSMGDVVGDHTETHPMMALLSPAAQQKQILMQAGTVRRYGGPFPRLWRPPYGSYDGATLSILRRLHMLMVLWTVDTNDYLRPGVAAIVHAAVAGARPGAIILMHDAGGDRTQTIAALPRIVYTLRQRGYRLVTIPQLVLDDPPRRPQRLPATLGGG